jgi:hypothetical protein
VQKRIGHFHQEKISCHFIDGLALKIHDGQCNDQTMMNPDGPCQCMAPNVTPNEIDDVAQSEQSHGMGHLVPSDKTDNRTRDET